MEQALELVDPDCTRRAEPVIHGEDPVEQVVTSAEDNSAKAVVTGSEGLSEIRGTLLGSLARKTRRLSPCTRITVE